MNSEPTPPIVDAIVLAGGRASRMAITGDAIDKPSLTVGGTSMLRRALDAVSFARTAVVVGPPRVDVPPSVLQTQESPAGGGPVAGIAAGIDCLGASSEFVIVLASDIPFVDANAVGVLVRAAERATETAVFAIDDAEHVQYLLGVWRTGALVHALAQLDSPENKPVRAILPRRHGTVAVTGTADCDTPDELRTARRVVAAGRTPRPAPTLDEARRCIRTRVDAMAPRSMHPAQAWDAVLAEPLRAATPLPAVNISAMDGYAVSGEPPWTPRADVAFAGTNDLADLAVGSAVRIATGARVPAGATSVIRDEHLRFRGDGTLERADDAPIRDDTRRVGEDWTVGTELAPPGSRVTAAVISTAIGAEVNALQVRGPVRARIVLSGNEIRSSGDLNAGQTRDTLGPVLGHYLDSCGIRAVDTLYPHDTADAFDDLFRAPDDVDLIVVIGATGSGAADQLRPALVDADAQMIVERIRIRPGGSQVTATLPDGTVVLGLPGNPLAAIGTLLVTAPSIVDALTRRTVGQPVTGLLTNWSAMVSDTARIVPVSRDGLGWRADTSVRTSHLGNLIGSDALAVVPPNVSADDSVELILLHR